VKRLATALALLVLVSPSANATTRSLPPGHVVAAGRAPGPESEAPTSQPDSTTQPVVDGCTRDPLGLLAGTAPHWAFVNRDPNPRYLRGVARDALPTYTDLFTAHSSYDMNVFFAPLPGYFNYLGTANTSTAQTQSKDDQNTMELEWEQASYPLFAWPTAGDDVEVMGSWIWDCGHWGPGDFSDPRYLIPGTQPGEKITGERTEIHPPRMIIVHRATPSTSNSGSAVTDAYISSRGTPAYADELHSTGQCQTPVQLCPQWMPVNDRDYDFDVAAPPAPRGATRVVWQVIDRGSVNAPQPQVTETPGGIHVHVPFLGWGTRGADMAFAKTFHVGWNATPTVQHLRVRLERLTWQAELDGPVPFMCVPDIPCTGNAQQSSPPDEVNIYVDAAGQWTQLTPPGLLSARPGEQFALTDSVDIFYTGAPRWRVLGRGRECDQPNFRECPVPTELGFNDDAGIFDDEFTGASGVGAHVGVATSDACKSVKAPSCFTLTYRIDDLGVAPASAPVGTHVSSAPGPLATTGQARPWLWAVAAILMIGLVGHGLSRRSR